MLPRLILTASGGPFLDASSAELAAVTPEQALRHPTWSMGAKITIDSRHAREQGPGGHRGTLAVRCRVRGDRGRHPSAERRALRRPVRRRLPQGPAGHPRYATTDPVRPDLPEASALTGSAPSTCSRPAASTSAPPTRSGSRRCGSRGRPAGWARARRPPSSPPTRSRSRGSSTGPLTSPRSRASWRRPSSASAATARPDPDLDELVALDSVVRSTFATVQIGARP